MKIENNEDTIAIVTRFFDAIERLKTDKVIRGLQTYTRRYDINRRNLAALRTDDEARGRFRPSWLSYLVRDYKVNPYWLLLGEGDFYISGFSPEIVKKLQEDCTKNK